MTAVSLWFWKDVRRLRSWLVVWAVVLGLRVANDAGWMQGAWRALDGLAVAATTILLILVTLLVVHDDPPADLRAFWTTRPVSGSQLFLAKALYVLALLVVPATAVDVADIAATGMQSTVAVGAFPEILLEWSAWAMAATALAAVTTTWPGFLGGALVAGIVGIGTAALSVFLLAAVGSNWYGLGVWHLDWNPDPSTHVMRVMAASRDAARAIGVSAIVALASALVAERTWTRRRVRAARGVLLCGVVALSVAWVCWPWGAAWPIDPAGDETTYDDVRLALDPIGRAEPTDGPGVKSSRMTVYGRFQFTGVPPGLVADVSRVEGTLGYADGATFEAVGSIGRPGMPSWDLGEVERLLDGARIVNVGEFGPAGMSPIVNLPAEQFAAHEKRTGRLELRVDALLRRYEIAAVLQLRVGETFRRDGEQFTVENVGTKEGYAFVQARSTYVSLWVRPAPPRAVRVFVFRFDPGTLWVLRNPIRREAVMPMTGAAFGFSWPAQRRLEEVSWALSYESPSGIDDAWLRDAELVRIGVTAEGKISRSFVLPAFSIDEATGSPTPRT